MRITLNFSQPQQTTTSSEPATPTRRSFSECLAADTAAKPSTQPSIIDQMNAQLSADAEKNALSSLRERIQEYLTQNALMSRIMLTPSASPSLDSE